MRARSVFPLLLSLTFVLFLGVFVLSGLGGAPPGASADSLAWNDLGGPTGWPAQGIALNPAYPADPTVLAGGGRPSGLDTWEGLGVFRSLDGGLTWAYRDGLERGALMDAAFSPNWQSDGFAVAGFWQGVWSTTDRGATWKMLSNLPDTAPGWVQAVAVSAPAAGRHTLLAGGPYGGVYQSADEGTTWTYSSDPGGVYRLAFHPAQPEVALAATNNGLWRSTDSGLQWTRVTTTTAVHDVAFAGDGTAVAAFDGYAWRSTDDGATWQRLSNTAIDRLFTLGLSADGAGLFAAADARLYRFDAQAGEFVAVPMQPALSRIIRLAPSPTFAGDRTLLIGTYDGVWRSTDSGQTVVRSAGFAPLAVYALAPAGPGAAGDLYAGTEFGVWRRSSNGWEPLNASPELGSGLIVRNLALSPAFAQDNTLFISGGYSVGLGSTVYRSTDRGATWQRMTGTEYTDQLALSPAFAEDRRVYMVAVQAVSVSTDGGATWTKAPFWDFVNTARSLAISPGFAQDRTLVAAGSGVYRSTDGGASWAPAASPPPTGPVNGTEWRLGRLHWSTGGKLYLPVVGSEQAAPYKSHSQLWVSADKGQTWSRLAAAPDLPVASLATGPTALGGGEAIYLSVYDANQNDGQAVAPDLYVSRNGGAEWLNLGAVPGGAAVLATSAGAADKLWAGNRGAWLLEAATMPTATPNPVRELLENRSFEWQGVWRIPDTAHDAGYSQDKHFEGYWSMRTGIVSPTVNVYSYSDFSQEVTLPVSTTLTLRLHRWPSSGAPAVEAGANDAGVTDAVLAATTLEEFYRALEPAAADLQYAMLIERPSNKIHFLFARLDNQQAWLAESYDLTKYGGKTVRLQFGTFNNGTGQVAAQYFDVLELQSTTPAPAPARYDWLPDIRKDSTGGGTVPPAQ